MTMRLGEIPDVALGYRDAVHFPIIAVEATEALSPGQKVRLTEAHKAYPDDRNFLGIVDPFLDAPVQRGQMCIVMLRPNAVRDLRHEWEFECNGYGGETRCEQEGCGYPGE